MPVITRSQTNSNKQTYSNNNVQLQPENINMSLPKPKPQVTFLTQEEFNASNYKKSRIGGYIKGLLKAVSLTAIKDDPEDWIKYEIYIPKDYIKSDKHIYVVAPHGYYWKYRHAAYAGYYYDLDKISNY